MVRTYKSISGLTYGHFDAALSQLGYVREKKVDFIEYRYPAEPKAPLVYKVYPLDTEVRGIDLLTTRAVLDGFGVITPRDFDFLLAHVTKAKVPMLAR